MNCMHCGTIKMSFVTILTSVLVFVVAEAWDEAADDAVTNETLHVTTEFGKVQGFYLNASEHRVLAAFLGIPFARPPIGSLRFRAPQDPLPWHGLRPATTNPSSCFQRRDDFFADFAGAREHEPLQEFSEDCLYLNVYVPDVDDIATSNGLAVMVWFHGGGFARGSSFPRGSEDWSPDPRELAAEGGIIVVTVQYRLGSLGFLFLDDEESAPGNVGLLDQRKALEWTKRNVFAFGGDPTRITLAGQGAGGVSAALQLALEAETTEEKGNGKLFRQLILHSAGLQHPWSYVEPAEAFRRTLKLASLLGCPTQGSKENVVLCLTKKPVEDIVNKEMGVEQQQPGINFNPFVVTLDGKMVREEPRRLARRLVGGGGLKVLIGSNQDEGSKSLMYFLPSLFPNKQLANPGMSKQDFAKSVGKMYIDSFQQVQDAICFQYTNWTDPDSEASNFAMAMKLVTDSQSVCPMEELIYDIAEHADVFRYKFSARNPHDLWPDWAGVKHGDELDYVFGRPLAQPYKYGEKDRLLSKFLIQSWAKFVSFGHPSGKDAIGKVGWPRHLPTAPHALLIDENREATVSEERNAEDCAFWNGLVPILQEGQKTQCQSWQKTRTAEDKKYLPIRVRSTIGKSPPTTTADTTETTSTTEKSQSTSTATTTSTTARFTEVLFPALVDDPPALNSLQSTSVLSADNSDFKVVDSRPKSTTRQTAKIEDSTSSVASSTTSSVTDAPKLVTVAKTTKTSPPPSPPLPSLHKATPMTTSTAEETGPKPIQITYQLSVMDRPVQQRPDSSSSSSNNSKSSSNPWSLYRPEEPGSSPIYVATGVMRTESSTKQADVVDDRRRPLTATVDKVYDPFNPSTYGERTSAGNKKKTKPFEVLSDDDDKMQVSSHEKVYIKQCGPCPHQGSHCLYPH